MYYLPTFLKLGLGMLCLRFGEFGKVGRAKMCSAISFTKNRIPEISFFYKINILILCSKIEKRIKTYYTLIFFEKFNMFIIKVNQIKFLFKNQLFSKIKVILYQAKFNFLNYKKIELTMEQLLQFEIKEINETNKFERMQKLKSYSEKWI